MRAIDVAARYKRLLIVDYLIEQGAALTSEPNNPSFLYWLASNLADKKSKNRIIQWVSRHKDKLLNADRALQPSHLDAILDNVTDWDSHTIHGGLCPIYYGALVENPHCLDKLPNWLNKPFSQQSWFRGMTLANLLAHNAQWDLLEILAASNEQVLDLNAASQANSHPDKGITLAWVLADNQQWDLLQTLAASNEQMLDLNAAPQAIAIQIKA